MEFLERIHVTCFASCYAIALLLDAVRLWKYDTKLVRWTATAFVTVGILTHGVYLFLLSGQSFALPTASRFESIHVIAWMVQLVHIYLLGRDRRINSGIFLLPVSLGLIAYSNYFGAPSDDEQIQARSLLGMGHGLLLLLGSVFTVGALVSAIMYFLRIGHLKSKSGIQNYLPSLERIDRINSVCIYFAWPLLTVGILIGFLLPGFDFRLFAPKTIFTLLAWIAFSFLAHYRFRSENRGKRTAVVTLVACLLVLFSVLGDPIFGGSHQTSTSNALSGE